MKKKPIKNLDRKKSKHLKAKEGKKEKLSNQKQKTKVKKLNLLQSSNDVCPEKLTELGDILFEFLKAFQRG